MTQPCLASPSQPTLRELGTIAALQGRAPGVPFSPWDRDASPLPSPQCRVLGISAVCTGPCPVSWTCLIPPQKGINHFAQRAAGPRHNETPLHGLNPRQVAAPCPGGRAGLLERLQGGFQTLDMV